MAQFLLEDRAEKECRSGDLLVLLFQNGIDPNDFVIPHLQSDSRNFPLLAVSGTWTSIS
jgi:hypothetical protein